VEWDLGLFVFRTFQASRKSDSQKSREAELPVGGQRWEGVTVVTVPPSQVGKLTKKSGAASDLVWCWGKERMRGDITGAGVSGGCALISK